jgi:hypothetical protein
LAAKEARRGSANERVGIALNHKVLGLASLSGHIAGSVGVLLLLVLLLLCVSHPNAAE